MRLAELRKSRHLTQTDLADILGIKQQVVSRYERNDVEMDYETLKKVSAFFDVSIDYLLGNTDFFYPDNVRSQLTDSERELLENFRALSPYLQGIAAETLRNWAGKPAQQTESTTKRA